MKKRSICHIVLLTAFCMVAGAPPDIDALVRCEKEAIITPSVALT